jgi:hypothetical protein
MRSRRAPARIVTAVLTLLVPACRSPQTQWEERVRTAFASQPLRPFELVSSADLEHLPPPVRRYLERVGVVGRPRVQNFRMAYDATMYRSPEQPMPGSGVQYSFTEHPTRLFFMRSRMMGLPVKVVHAYENEHALMRVRVAFVKDVVDLATPELSRAETVTVLNDFCVMAPAALIDPRFTWEAMDDRTARVFFQNGTLHVSAVLHFDDAGDLVDFESTDRRGKPDDGYKWTTPLRAYRDFGGYHLAGEGDGVYHYEDRPSFTYGKFVIRSVSYNVADPSADLPARAD